MPAPTFIEKATAATSSAATISLAYAGFTDIQAGDWLFAALLSYQEPGGSIGDITPDDPDWQEIGGGIAFRDSSLNNVGTFKVFRKVATGLETGNADFTRSGSNGGSNAFLGQMYQFRGTNIVLNATATNILGDGNATITWGNVTVVGLETTAIAFVGQITDDPGSPAGYTNDASDASGGVVLYLECNSEENTSGGIVTASGGSADGWATVHITIFNATGYSFIPDH